MGRSINNVIIKGNLTKDADTATTQSGQARAAMSIALNHSYKDASGNWQEATDFVDLTAWGPLAERCAEKATKGREVFVTGRLSTRQWEQDGVKRSKTEVLAQNIEFIGE